MKAEAIILGKGEWAIGGARLNNDEENESCVGIIFRHLKTPRAPGEVLPVHDDAIYDSDPVCIGFLQVPDIERVISLLQVLKRVIEEGTQRDRS